MNGLRFDFGLLIAYILPGFLLFCGFSSIIPGADDLLTTGDNENSVVSGFLIAALSVVLGMGISIVRFSTIDQTYSFSINFFNHKKKPHYQGFESTEINYEKLTSEGVLAAYLEAKASEKRPHQFYGNILVISLIISITHIFINFCSPQKSVISTPFCITIILLSLLIFYPASRRSCWKYSDAINKLNATKNAK